MATTKFSTIVGQAQVVPVVGPTTFQTLVIGGSVSAPTMGSNTNAYTAMQDGEKLEMSLTYFQNGAGAAGSGVYVFPLPPGRTVSVLECPVSHYNGSGLGVVGECEFWDGTKLYEGTVHVFNATNLYCTIGNELTTPTQMSSTTFSLASTNWRLSFKARFLCTEFVGNGYQAQGAGLATSTRPGIVYRTPQTAITITSPQAGFATTRAQAIAYMDNNGIWRMTFNISASFTSASVSALVVSISGTVFKNVTNFFQPCSSLIGSGPSVGYCFPATGDISVGLPATVTAGVHVSGDVELNAKPSWA